MKCSALLPLVPFLLINSTNGTSDGHTAPALRGQVSRDRNTPRRLARKPKPPKETTTTTQPTSVCNARRLHLDADEWQQHRVLPRGGGGGKKNNEVTTTTSTTTQAPPTTTTQEPPTTTSSTAVSTTDATTTQASPNVCPSCVASFNAEACDCEDDWSTSSLVCFDTTDPCHDVMAPPASQLIGYNDGQPIYDESGKLIVKGTSVQKVGIGFDYGCDDGTGHYYKGSSCGAWSISAKCCPSGKVNTNGGCLPLICDPSSTPDRCCLQDGFDYCTGTAAASDGEELPWDR